jgi:hypothetical protein
MSAPAQAIAEPCHSLPVAARDGERLWDLPKRTVAERLRVRDVSLSVQCQPSGPIMLINIQCFRAGLVSALLSDLPVLMLVTSTVVMVQPTLAQNGASQAAPPSSSPSQAGPGYWTPERMREAKPAMPTLPGTPQSGSSTSGPSGPRGGASGQEPQAQPIPANR